MDRFNNKTRESQGAARNSGIQALPELARLLGRHAAKDLFDESDKKSKYGDDQTSPTSPIDRPGHSNGCAGECSHRTTLD